MGWLLTLNPIVRYAILAGLVLLSLRWWGNRQYDEGRVAGELSMSETIADAVEAAREAERNALNMERAELSAEREAVETVRLEMERVRAAVASTLNQRLQAIETTFREENIRVSQVPTTDLPIAIRTQLAVLRSGRPAADLGGAAGSPDAAGGATGGP